MFYGGLYLKFQTEDVAERMFSKMPRMMEQYVTRHVTWNRSAASEWAPKVQRDGCYVLVPGASRVSLQEYGGDTERLVKGDSLFQDICLTLADISSIGFFNGQCCRRSEGYFGGHSIACTYDGRVLEFRIMSGWTRFCDSCASALREADGAGRPEPELRVIWDNPVALLDPTESCVFFDDDCNLQVSYQRWGRVKGSGWVILKESDVWDERAGAWRQVPLPPVQPPIYRVRIGEKTYELQG